MAAEKLTVARLFQLVFLLSVLIAAFTWRTVTYENPNTMSKDSESNISCDITKAACSFNIDNKKIVIDVQQRPIMQNAEMKLSISGINSKLDINATGVNMAMGRLKFSPLESKDGHYLYSAFLPKCKHNDMTWKFEIVNNDTVEDIIFTSIKDK